MSDAYFKNVVEAALLAAARPVSIAELLQIFDEQSRPSPKEMRAVLEQLAADYEGRGVAIKETATGFRFQVRTEFAHEVSRLWPDRPRKYSRALLETLALIAYRQPITRAEIENVRGVAVNPEIVKTLMERNWVRVVGHRDVPGQPELLGTTAEFLDYFSLKSIEDLPPLADLKSLTDLNLQLPLPVNGRAGDNRRGAAPWKPTPAPMPVKWPWCRSSDASIEEGGDRGLDARVRRRRRRRRTLRARRFRRGPRGGAAVRRNLRQTEQLMARPRPTPAGVAERLQKYLAQRGLGSRRAVEEWIRAGRLSVNGRIAELGQKVSHADDIRLDGRAIKIACRRRRAGVHVQPFAWRSAARGRRRTLGADRSAAEDRGPPLRGREPHAGYRRRARARDLRWRAGREAAARESPCCSCEFSVRIKGVLGPDHIEGVKSGKIDRPSRMTVESVSTSEAQLEGSNRWYSIVVRGASGKDIRQLFERQGALVSRVLRVVDG